MTEKNIFIFVRSAAIILGIICWLFITRPLIVQGHSMYPNFNKDTTAGNILTADYIFLDILGYKINDPKRFDVVVFYSPVEENRLLLKRVIALPGETVNVRRDGIYITRVDGKRIKIGDEFTNKEEAVTYRNQDLILKENEYYTLGDNRANSFDSRAWGVLDEKRIIGRVNFRLLPTDDFGINPGSIDISKNIDILY